MISPEFMYVHFDHFNRTSSFTNRLHNQHNKPFSTENRIEIEKRKICHIVLSIFLIKAADNNRFLNIHFDFDTNSGETNGKLLKGKEKSLLYSQVFVTSKFDTNKVEIRQNIGGNVRGWKITSTKVVFLR